jgi:uncharacterized protein
MEDSLLEKLIAEYMSIFSNRIAFVWHGGEPLLAGMPFFQRIIDLQKKYLRQGQIIRNSIQTNGTLINDKWAKFFKKYNFRIGVSLDGNEEAHNRFRKTKTKSSSFKSVIEGIKILRKNDIEPGIIQTVTKSNLKQSEKISHFFIRELNLKGWGINPYLDVTNTNSKMRGESITSDEFYRFLKEIIDLWLEIDDPDLCIREIENVAAGVMGKQTLNCSYNGCCTGFFCVDYNGVVYPCDRFTDHPEYQFGNLYTQSLQDILNSEERLHYASAVNSRSAECADCQWLTACHNGCTHHRLGNVSEKYYYCESRKKIFSYIKGIIENYAHPVL